VSWPAEHVPEDWCWSCGRVEPDQPGDYLTCLECWHVFRTPEELLAVQAERWGIVETDVAAVWVCPLCTHDF